MFRTFLTTTAIVAIAGAASAEGLTFAHAGYNFTRLTADGFGPDDAVDVSRLEGEVEYLTGQFLLGANVQSHDSDGIFGDSRITTYGLSGAYLITPEVMVGAGLTGLSFSGDIADESFNGYEVFGQYKTEQFGVAISYATPDVDGDGFDLELISLYGQASVTPAIDLAVAIQTVSDSD